MVNKRAEGATRETATLSQTLLIADLVREHCRLDEETGFARYDMGWSDETVAAAAGMSTDTRVKHVRRELIGHLPGKTSKTKAQQKLEARVDKLEVKLEDWMFSVLGRLEKIEAKHEVLVAFANKMQNGGGE